MRVIFLDIDGVLNCRPRMFGLHDDLVSNLKSVLDATDARIVVSSSWRLYPDEPNVGPGIEWRKVLARMLGRKDDGIFIGNTPDLYDSDPDVNGWVRRSRGEEIRTWIDENKVRDMRWVVIDDDVSDILPFIDQEHVFKTDNGVGLTDEISSRIIDYLDRE